MMSHATRLFSKLAPPSAAGLVPRERVFALLDRFRRRPITWVQGPPGAGKTSVVSSWIDARRWPCLWYQVDAGDADPATFFHYLREAAPAGRALPALTPEYLADLGGFTRRFFRQLTEPMPPQSVIVLDNFSEVADGAALAPIVREAAAVVPDGLTFVIVSRADPPVAFADAIAHADLARIQWDELRLDVEETQRFAGVTADRAHALHERTGGWAAGLRLLLEGRRGAGASPAAIEARHTAFEYLATEVFDRSPPELRDLWLATACLPSFTAEMASALASRPDAGEQLEALAARRYFVERRPGAAPTYQYHALFSEFLQRQLERHRDGHARQALAHRSAALLAAAGESEAAFRLYCEAGDFAAAVPLVLEAAPGLLAEGRWQTVQSALASLPEALLEETPWLLYWLGLAQGMTDPPRGRVTIERAHSRFREARDLVGQAMSVAAVLDSFCRERNYLPAVDPWLDAALALYRQGLAFPNAAAELRFWSSLLFVAAYRQAAAPLARVAGERTLALLDVQTHAAEKAWAGAALLHFLTYDCEYAAAHRVERKLEPLLASRDVPPIARFTVICGRRELAHHAGDFAGALELSLEAQRIVNDHGFVFARTVMREFEIWVRAEMGDFATATRLLAELAPEIASERCTEVAMFHLLGAWFALERGDAREALDEANAAAAAIGAASGAGGPVVCVNGVLALAAIECEAWETARTALAAMRDAVGNLERSGPLAPFVHYVRTEYLLRTGEADAARASLRLGLAAARKAGTVDCVIFLPRWLARLCALALEAGIEPEFAKVLATARGLEPPSPDLEAWPWPISIRTLGRFEVVVGGEVVRHARKAQRRVLDLLKALVALGPAGVSRDAVAAALWPDSEGDAARDVFEVTLHRLRKLLGRDDAVQLTGGMLQLDRGIAWVDCASFERLATKANGEHGGFDVAAAERALALYAGPFLQTEDETPWLLPARERLRSRFLRLAVRAGQHHEHAGSSSRAIEIYSAALEAEPLAEELYRRLMLALAAHGRRAEALDVYRRCSRMLSVVLRAAPSRETEAAHAAIMQAA